MGKDFELPQWRVLIVEDDPLVQLGLEQTFIDYPSLSIVGQVEDGYLAVEASARQSPDLILMDIGLPGIDGITATQQIKARQPGIRVIMLTSHRSKNEVLAALASGADAYCVKGCEINVLLTAIAAVSQGALYLDVSIARTILSELKIQTSEQIEPHSLTKREYDVLLLLVEGLNNRQIAAQLFISPNSVVDRQLIHQAPHVGFHRV
ncbi:MAG: response regulator transcription factor, partial [Cyanobacteria bacterium P01_F01_bin.42]